MTIQEAKEEIIRTVQAYTGKNPDGSWKIPQVRQRPLLLIGPPGIGKTAIMEQAANSCHVGLVAYTITHHTRQSAIGLPVIREKCYGGSSVSVTEYTMSEIIASVYECMEKTGYKEGILFIDEINCVSETLAPAMLQFLQCKTFGSHQVPEGWVIVAAGNPPGYNKSVRDFDVVTLDRVRMLKVEEDLSVWKQYARHEGFHESILSYLDIKPQNFYQMEPCEEGTWFVTARGWEDLSRMIFAYEDLQLPVSSSFVEEFLQYPRIARDFASYYEFYRKYADAFPVQRILEEEPIPEDLVRLAEEAAYDERLTLIHLLAAALFGQSRTPGEDSAEEQAVYRNRWNHAFLFLQKIYGDGLEMHIFMRELKTEPVWVCWMDTAYLPVYRELLEDEKKQEQKEADFNRNRAVFEKL
ncbi:MAG: ATP-binding protein [Lachnospiraceae bacterium]